MNTKTILAGSAATLAALSCASVALAQAKPPAKPAAVTAPAAPPTVITANVPGICILSREGLIGGSTVGKFIQTRIQQLSTQINAELTGEQTSLQNDAKGLEAKKSTLAQAAYQQQGAALQQRAEALQQKAQLRDRELQATEQKAVQRVLQEATPLVSDQVKSKQCAVVLDAGTILAANPGMDLTAGVITALNAKMTQFDFDREHLDAQGAAQR